MADFNRFGGIRLTGTLDISFRKRLWSYGKQANKTKQTNKQTNT